MITTKADTAQRNEEEFILHIVTKGRADLYKDSGRQLSSLPPAKDEKQAKHNQWLLGLRSDRSHKLRQRCDADCLGGSGWARTVFLVGRLRDTSSRKTVIAARGPGGGEAADSHLAPTASIWE